MKKPKSPPFHYREESDELVYAVCDRFLNYFNENCSQSSDNKGPVARIANWLETERNRPDLKREKIYPLLREAVRRNYLILKPPVEKSLRQELTRRYRLESHRGEIDVVNVAGSTASSNVSSFAADKVIELIHQVAQDKRRRAIEQGEDPDKIKVHLGIGAGYATMLVAKRLAIQVNSGGECPSLVLHTISSGGFFVEEPHKSPIAYFGYFDDRITKIEYVALFSETIVAKKDYEQIMKSPSFRRCYERRDEIDIIITSMASGDDVHGLLRQNMSYLIKEKAIPANALTKMYEAGFVGDVQFRPYSAQGPMDDDCPIRAVALFELNDLVRFARSPGKYVVLVGGPCGECGNLKTEALRPLLANKNMRLWTHLVTDVKTANDLLKPPPTRKFGDFSR